LDRSVTRSDRWQRLLASNASSASKRSDLSNFPSLPRRLSQPNARLPPSLPAHEIQAHAARVLPAMVKDGEWVYIGAGPFPMRRRQLHQYPRNVGMQNAYSAAGRIRKKGVSLIYRTKSAAGPAQPFHNRHYANCPYSTVGPRISTLDTTPRRW